MFNQRKEIADHPIMVPMTREEVKAFADWCRLTEDAANQSDKSIYLHHYNSSRGYGHLHILEPSETMSILQNELKAANQRAVDFGNKEFRANNLLSEKEKTLELMIKELNELRAKVETLSKNQRSSWF